MLKEINDYLNNPNLHVSDDCNTGAIAITVDLSSGKVPYLPSLGIDPEVIASTLSWDLRGATNAQELPHREYDVYAAAQDIFQDIPVPYPGLLAECVELGVLDVDGNSITEMHQLSNDILKASLLVMHPEYETVEAAVAAIQSGTLDADQDKINELAAVRITEMGLTVSTRTKVHNAGECGLTYGALWRSLQAGNREYDPLGMLFNDILTDATKGPIGIRMWDRHIQAPGMDVLNRLNNGAFFKDLNEYMFTVSANPNTPDVLDMTVTLGNLTDIELPEMLTRYALLLFILATETQKHMGYLTLTANNVHYPVGTGIESEFTESDIEYMDTSDYMAQRDLAITGAIDAEADLLIPAGKEEDAKLGAHVSAIRTKHYQEYKDAPHSIYQIMTHMNNIYL